MTITREDLADAVHRASIEVSPKEARELVDDVFELIAATVVAGEAVKISTFGNFIPVNAPERIGRNPKRPAEEHLIPAHRRIAFRSAFELNRQVSLNPTSRYGRGYLR